MNLKKQDHGRAADIAAALVRKSGRSLLKAITVHDAPPGSAGELARAAFEEGWLSLNQAFRAGKELNRADLRKAFAVIEAKAQLPDPEKTPPRDFVLAMAARRKLAKELIEAALAAKLKQKHASITLALVAADASDGGGSKRSADEEIRRSHELHD